MIWRNSTYLYAVQYNGLVVQMNRTPDLHSGGRGFESHQVHNKVEIGLMSVSFRSYRVLLARISTFKFSGIAQFGAERSRGGVHDDGITLLNMTEGFRKSLNCYVL